MRSWSHLLLDGFAGDGSVVGAALEDLGFEQLGQLMQGADGVVGGGCDLDAVLLVHGLTSFQMLGGISRRRGTAVWDAGRK